MGTHMTGGRLLHGGDYNPEQWLERPEILEEDIILMKEAGINCVTLGVFSWSMLEPEEGQLLAQIVQRFRPPADPQRALEDYISTIQYEHLKKANREDDNEDMLREIAERKLQQERERGGK